MARRRRKARRRGRWLILAVALVAAGFLTRRIVAPRMIRYLTHRPLQHRSSYEQPDPAAQADPAIPSEHLTESDRRALTETIKRKSGER
jgi:hypothetical protein